MSKCNVCNKQVCTTGADRVKLVLNSCFSREFSFFVIGNDAMMKCMCVCTWPCVCLSTSIQTEFQVMTSSPVRVCVCVCWCPWPTGYKISQSVKGRNLEGKNRNLCPTDEQQRGEWILQLLMYYQSNACI